MLPDRVSNPGPLTYESGALPIALRGLAACAHSTTYRVGMKCRLRSFQFITLFYKNLCIHQVACIASNDSLMWCVIRGLSPLYFPTCEVTKLKATFYLPSLPEQANTMANKLVHFMVKTVSL